jgi:hypothetical protein
VNSYERIIQIYECPIDYISRDDDAKEMHCHHKYKSQITTEYDNVVLVFRERRDLKII